MIDFGAVYNEWAENEYEPLFGGGSPFWRHFPVPGPENLIIFQKIASKLRFRESARKYLENGVSWAGIGAEKQPTEFGLNLACLAISPL